MSFPGDKEPAQDAVKLAKIPFLEGANQSRLLSVVAGDSPDVAVHCRTGLRRSPLDGAVVGFDKPFEDRSILAQTPMFVLP